MGDPVGCARPTGKVLGQATNDTAAPSTETKEVQIMSVRVGQKAPDFEAPAFHQGKFTSVKLSDNLGHWTLLCFYPGDFTFV